MYWRFVELCLSWHLWLLFSIHFLFDQLHSTIAVLLTPLFKTLKRECIWLMDQFCWCLLLFTTTPYYLYTIWDVSAAMPKLDIYKMLMLCCYFWQWHSIKKRLEWSFLHNANLIWIAEVVLKLSVWNLPIPVNTL